MIVVRKDYAASCWARLSPLQRLKVLERELPQAYLEARKSWPDLTPIAQDRWRIALAAYVEIAQRLGGVCRYWARLTVAGDEALARACGWDANGSPTAEVA